MWIWDQMTKKNWRELEGTGRDNWSKSMYWITLFITVITVHTIPGHAIISIWLTRLPKKTTSHNDHIQGGKKPATSVRLDKRAATSVRVGEKPTRDSRDYSTCVGDGEKPTTNVRGKKEPAVDVGGSKEPVSGGNKLATGVKGSKKPATSVRGGKELATGVTSVEAIKDSHNGSPV